LHEFVLHDEIWISIIYVFNYDEQKEIHMDSMAPAERDMQRKRLGRPVFPPGWLPKKIKAKDEHTQHGLKGNKTGTKRLTSPTRSSSSKYRGLRKEQQSWGLPALKS
jgi:hypothetical protein